MPPKPPRWWRVIPLTAGIAELGFFVVHGPPATISGQDKAFTSAGALLIITGVPYWVRGAPRSASRFLSQIMMVRSPK